MQIKSAKELEVYKKANQLAMEIFELSEDFEEESTTDFTERHR